MARLTLPEKIESTDQAKSYHEAIQAELERIDIFLKKYEGQFCLRYKDGDLKVMTLTEIALKKLASLKTAWSQALKKLENDHGLASDLEPVTEVRRPF